MQLGRCDHPGLRQTPLLRNREPGPCVRVINLGAARRVRVGPRDRYFETRYCALSVRSRCSFRFDIVVVGPIIWTPSPTRSIRVDRVDDWKPTLLQCLEVSTFMESGATSSQILPSPPSGTARPHRDRQAMLILSNAPPPRTAWPGHAGQDSEWISHWGIHDLTARSCQCSVLDSPNGPFVEQAIEEMLQGRQSPDSLCKECTAKKKKKRKKKHLGRHDRRPDSPVRS